MSVEKIERKILESARAEAERIVRRAEEEVRALLATAKTRSEKRAAEAVQDAKEALQQKHDQQVTSANAANKLKLLARKAAILDDVFDKAVETFIGKRDGAYHRWLAAQLDLVAGEEGSLVPAQEDRPALAELLSAQDRSGHRLSDDSLPLRGGFVLQGDRVDIDLSLDAQLVELKADILPELAAKTFPPGEENPE